MVRKLPVGAAAVLGVALTICTSRADSRLIVLGHRVWQVSSQGRVTPFPYAFPAGYDDNVLGSTIPLPSPDGSWIGFGDFGGDYDLHLLDVRSGRERRITQFGRRPRKGYTFADALLNAWSADSRQLLLTVEAGETTSEWGELLVPDAPYGSYIYDLATGTTKAVALPKQFQLAAWLPEGRFLGVIPGQGPGEQETVVFRPGDAEGVPVRAPSGTLSRLQVSEDGQGTIGLLVGNRESAETAQVVKIDLATMSITPVASLSSWTGNERPALSPHGKHFSYTRLIRMVKGISEESLIVDGRSVLSCPGPIDSRWISDVSVAVACQGEVLVLDAISGRTLSRHRAQAAGGK